VEALALTYFNGVRRPSSPESTAVMRRLWRLGVGGSFLDFEFGP